MKRKSAVFKSINIIFLFGILTLVICTGIIEKGVIIKYINKNKQVANVISTKDTDNLKANKKILNNNEVKQQVVHKEVKKDLETVTFTGNAEHIFFHPLIANTKLAFVGDYQTKSMDDWFVTVKEFNKVIEQLYKNNYILININSIYEQKKENGIITMKRKPIKVPKGKKPLIISIDDMNYYGYMIEHGTVGKLIIDNEGKIASYTPTKDRKGEVRYDNAIVPILDKFVQEHPDFSLNGAKATIALTGFEGILGYRTQHENKNYDLEINKVIPVIKKLKETGWNFASHSYGHPNIAQISYNKLKNDTDKWEKEVKSLVGDTSVFIYPYGDAVKYKDTKFQYLKSKGFNIFCAVGPTSYEELVKDVAQTDRRHVDGVSLRNQRKEFLDLYDANKILDKEGRTIRKNK